MADGKFGYREGLSVVQLVIFPIYLYFAVIFGFKRRNGWFCIGVFSFFRIASGSCMLARINNASLITLLIWTIVCESIGIVLMIFLLYELSERVNRHLQILSPRVLYVPQLLTLADVGVSIAAFVRVAQIEDRLAPTKYSRAGMALIAATYVWVAGMTGVLWLRRKQLPSEEIRAIDCAAACTPLLAVRVLYSLLYVVIGNKTLNAVVGNPTIYLFMTMVPEITIVALCVWTILKLPPPEKTKKVAENKNRISRCKRVVIDDSALM